MTIKTIEIRDAGTFIPALAIRLDPSNGADRYLLSRAGYGRTPEQQREYILLTSNLGGGNSEIRCDPYDWPGDARTYPVAHQWLIEHFDEIESGAVVDVEFILGETPSPKVSEQFDDNFDRARKILAAIDKAACIDAALGEQNNADQLRKRGVL